MPADKTLVAVPLVALLCAATAFFPNRAQAQPLLDAPSPHKGPPVARMAAPQTPKAISSKTTTEPGGLLCVTTTFEGVGDLAPIPTFDGISLPGWLGLIDSDNGGSGNFAHEPSPNTVAFWRNAATQEIRLANPAKKITFEYTSAVTVKTQAFNAGGCPIGRRK